MEIITANWEYALIGILCIDKIVALSPTEWDDLDGDGEVELDWTVAERVSAVVDDRRPRERSVDAAGVEGFADEGVQPVEEHLRQTPIGERRREGGLGR